MIEDARNAARLARVLCAPSLARHAAQPGVGPTEEETREGDDRAMTAGIDAAAEYKALRDEMVSLFHRIFVTLAAVIGASGLLSTRPFDAWPSCAWSLAQFYLACINAAVVSVASIILAMALGLWFVCILSYLAASYGTRLRAWEGAWDKFLRQQRTAATEAEVKTGGGGREIM